MTKKTIVIGAGLGGLSAAISLAAAGQRVELFEKNAHAGGKLNLREENGFKFDLGPSILTMPQVFEQLFQRAGKKMNDYVQTEPVLPHWRNFFEDKTVFDFHPDPDLMQAELDRLGPGTSGFCDFLDYSRRQLELCEKGYFSKGYDTFGEVLRGYGFKALKFDNFRSMHDSVNRYVFNPYLSQALDYFAKYVGSSPYDAPGLLNLMAYLQFGYGLWYVTGGMYNMTRGLEKLARELGVEIHYNAEVTRLEKQNKRVESVRLQDGSVHTADYVVCNMEVIPAYRGLLEEDTSWTKKLEERFEPACSGLVLHLGIEGEYPQLAHHNFFYSANPREHFNCIFHEKILSPDPTIYLVAPCKSDKTLAPAGHEIIKILPHIPHLNDDRPLTAADYDALEERVLAKLERMGLTDLKKRIRVRHRLLPADIQRLYYSNKGSIYGVVSSRIKNQAFRLPKKSVRYDNLYFVGGSVNPGCGMPMVTLSGQLTADKIIHAEKN